MGKSARVLGWEFDRSAREMNELFREHGYLEGDPGAYRVTAKGLQYAEEKYHSRGSGGSAQYNPSWETRTWKDGTAAALQTDINLGPDGIEVADGVIAEDYDDGGVTFALESLEYDADEDDDDQFVWIGLAIAGIAVGAVLIAPYVEPFYNDKLKPAAKKLTDKLKRQEAVQAPAQADSEESE